MDEPLSNLDAKLRVQTRTQIASLQRRLGVTTVYVTHDQVEAMTMGDRVAVLKDGILMQCDSPRRMYDHPDNVFVAGFIGSPAMNLLDVDVADGGVKVGGSTVPVERAILDASSGKNITLGVRPEDLELTTEGQGIPVTVDVVEELGADAYIYGSTKAHQHVEADEDSDAPERPFIARVDGRTPPKKGETVFLAPKTGHVHAFDATSGQRLGG
jgi:multiple sugar transport system ATP-binding protein